MSKILVAFAHPHQPRHGSHIFTELLTTYRGQIDFRVADAHAVAALGQFHIVSSVMVFQFVDDFETLIGKLAAAVATDGLLIFAVFNPAYVVERIAANSTSTKAPGFVG
ncbi:MAG: hypothetical protein M3069_04330 [Chloroflexota bacterium]|nr:hypothetical protein [Chloroflexota bacterium]